MCSHGLVDHWLLAPYGLKLHLQATYHHSGSRSNLAGRLSTLDGTALSFCKGRLVAATAAPPFYQLEVSSALVTGHFRPIPSVF